MHFLCNFDSLAGAERALEADTGAGRRHDDAGARVRARFAGQAPLGRRPVGRGRVDAQRVVRGRRGRHLREQRARLLERA